MKCIFLGYPRHIKGYKVFDLSALKTFVSRNVVFLLIYFPTILDTVHTPFVFPDFPQTYDSVSCIPAKSVSQNSIPPINLPLANSAPVHSSSNNNDAPNLRRSERTKHLPNYLEQYYCGTVTQIPSANPASSSYSSSGTPYSIFSFLFDSRLYLKHKAFTSAISLFFNQRLTNKPSQFLIGRMS